jgi:hypothetical protein
MVRRHEKRNASGCNNGKGNKRERGENSKGAAQTLDEVGLHGLERKRTVYRGNGSDAPGMPFFYSVLFAQRLYCSTC